MRAGLHIGWVDRSGNWCSLSSVNLHQSSQNAAGYIAAYNYRYTTVDDVVRTPKRETQKGGKKHRGREKEIKRRMDKGRERKAERAIKKRMECETSNRFIQRIERIFGSMPLRVVSIAQLQQQLSHGCHFQWTNWGYKGQAGRQTDTHTQANRQASKHTQRLVDRQIERQTDREIGRQIDIQINIQIDLQRDIQANTIRHIGLHRCKGGRQTCSFRGQGDVGLMGLGSFDMEVGRGD